MDIAAFLKALEATGLATRIRDGLYLFPMLEATHVVGLALVFGTITIIDLRLLGFASVQRSFQRMSKDILKWTWLGFAITIVTGSLMFITNATVYYHNFYFRAKMLLLALSGLNMMIFELTDGRKVPRWDKAPSAPRLGRNAAILSIVIWIGVVFMGRMIGFTTSRATLATPPPANVDFDNFLDAAPNPAPNATPNKTPNAPPSSAQPKK